MADDAKKPRNNMWFRATPVVPDSRAMLSQMPLIMTIGFFQLQKQKALEPTSKVL